MVMGKKNLSFAGLQKCKDKGRFVMVINGSRHPSVAR